MTVSLIVRAKCSTYLHCGVIRQERESLGMRVVDRFIKSSGISGRLYNLVSL